MGNFQNKQKECNSTDMRSFLIWILLSFCLFSDGLIAAENTTSKSKTDSLLQTSSNEQLDLPLLLNSGWFFCPVQNYQPDVDISILNCKPINLPVEWESIQPGYDGYALLYNRFTLPNENRLTNLGLFIKRLRDADKVFLNRQYVGATGEFPPDFQKAVLYSRLYPIPQELLKPGEDNLLTIWIYNDARPGGITQETPVIDNYFELVDQFYDDNLKALAFIIIIFMFALVHFIYFMFHRQSFENFSYAIFLILWGSYLYTITNLPLTTELSMNFLFRSNIALFFLIFSTFPFFLYQFFQQKIPRALKIIIGISLAMAPFCFLLPEPKLLYYPLQFIEVLTIPALLIIYHLLFKVIRAKLAYAKLIACVIVLYTCFGAADIFIDLLGIQQTRDFEIFSLWGLLILSLCLTLIMAHKNLVYYKDATVDRLTNALRYSEFISRLDLEVFRADRENHPLVLLMIDLDNFKKINDQFGHMQGDKVLVMVAEALRGELRHFDLLGRYGGDEFCVAAILENDREIRNFVIRLHDKINKLCIEKKNQEVPIRATFGAVIRHSGEEITSQTLVERADNLLITAKSNQKGTVLW
ncbi:sensor domain-containing diguanylate cyclase [Aliikangiella marina]|nr:GGDEF domain-containing protein [Aliikangiella marina]